jgi:hypothetical protein
MHPSTLALLTLTASFAPGEKVSRRFARAVDPNRRRSRHQEETDQRNRDLFGYRAFLYVDCARLDLARARDLLARRSAGAPKTIAGTSSAGFVVVSATYRKRLRKVEEAKRTLRDCEIWLASLGPVGGAS